MADKRYKCKVCEHKKAGQITTKIRNGDSINSLHKLYGLSRSALNRHKSECMVQLLAEDKATHESLIGDSLINQVKGQLDLVQKMIVACDEYLTDPDDPSKYFIGARGDEIDVVYRTYDKEEKKLSNMQKKSTLQNILDAINDDGNFVVMNITVKHTDPRDLLLKAITKLEATAKMIFESSQKLIEWEHKKKAIEKVANEGGTISFEKEVNLITERVIVAMAGSNSEELSRLAGLPELD